MKILRIQIQGFRGISQLTLTLAGRTTILGPSSVGKSTILEALALAFGRYRRYGGLTEHDFYGSDPSASSRIRIITTLGEFEPNDPFAHPDWFREDRAVPKWFGASTGTIAPEPDGEHSILCAQFGFAARFDFEDLEVETIRYFHDDDDVVDPFADDGVSTVPPGLLRELGFYLVSARRGGERHPGLGSGVLRRALLEPGEIPAPEILAERDRLRNPTLPLEASGALSKTAKHIDGFLARMFADKPRLRVRLTDTDSASLLQNLIFHYKSLDSPVLPVERHGSALQAIQAMLLVLELGTARTSQGRNFILALDEPELHLSPHLQRQLLWLAQRIATQIICVTHSPTVGAAFASTETTIVERRQDGISAVRLLSKPLPRETPNALRKLFLEGRSKVTEAMLHPYVLIPEGRIDAEWLRLLVEIAETSVMSSTPESEPPRFGVLVGIIPTADAQVVQTFEAIRAAKERTIVLVDGDDAGDDYIRRLNTCTPKPARVIQWRAGWTIEDVVAWVIEADPAQVLVAANDLLSTQFETLSEVLDALRSPTKRGGLKGDYLAYEALAAAIRESGPGVARVRHLLGILESACSVESGLAASVEPQGEDGTKAHVRVAP